MRSTDVESGTPIFCLDGPEGSRASGVTKTESTPALADKQITATHPSKRGASLLPRAALLLISFS